MALQNGTKEKKKKEGKKQGVRHRESLPFHLGAQLSCWKRWQAEGKKQVLTGKSTEVCQGFQPKFPSCVYRRIPNCWGLHQAHKVRFASHGSKAGGSQGKTWLRAAGNRTQRLYLLSFPIHSEPGLC